MFQSFAKLAAGAAQIQIVETVLSKTDADVVSHFVDLPLNIEAGDLLFIFAAGGTGDQTWTFASGWTQYVFRQLGSAGNIADGMGAAAAFRIADGLGGAPETSPLNISCSLSGAGSFVALRVINHAGFDGSNFSQSNTGAGGVVITPAPITPSFGAVPALFINNTSHSRYSTTITVQSVNYVDEVDIAGFFSSAQSGAKCNVNHRIETTGVVTESPSQVTMDVNTERMTNFMTAIAQL